MDDQSHQLLEEVCRNNVAIVSDMVSSRARDNSTNAPDDTVKTILKNVYAVQCFFGTIANIIFLSTIISMRLKRGRRKSTAANRTRAPASGQDNFILLLAISDLCMCCFTAPSTMKFTLERYWPYGEALCKIVSSLQAMNIFVSTLSITAISANRFLVVLFPLSMQSRMFLIEVTMCLFTWIISVLMAMPMFLGTGLFDELTPDGSKFLEENCGATFRMCSEMYHPLDDPFKSAVYTIFIFLLQYVLPLACLIALNFRICRKVENQAAFRQRQYASASIAEPTETLMERQSSDPSPVRTTRSRAVDRVKYTVSAVIATFALTWLPFNIYMLLQIASPNIKYNVTIHSICHMIGVLSACLDPVIYGVANKIYMEELRLIVSNIRRTVGRIFDLRNEIATINGRSNNNSATAITSYHKTYQIESAAP